MPAPADGHAADSRCYALPPGPAPRRVSGRWAATGPAPCLARGRTGTRVHGHDLTADRLMAATAMVHGFTLVTADRSLPGCPDIRVLPGA